MKARDIIDVRYVTWFGFHHKTGERYYFWIKVCQYAFIGDWPLVELGVGVMGMLPAIAYTLQEVLEEVPIGFAENDTVPYINGSGEYDIPEDIKFDKASSPCRIDPATYIALSVIPWSTATFYKSVCEYIPVDSAYTSIPSSIPGKHKVELPNESAIFMPDKDKYTWQPKVVADRDVSGGNASGFMDWAFFYSGQDLQSNHIWRYWEVAYPYATKPWVHRGSSPAFIDRYLAVAQGFIAREDPYSGGYSVMTDAWEPILEAWDSEFFPARVFPCGGVLPGVIAGLGLLNLIGGLDLSVMNAVDIFKFLKEEH